MLKGSKTAVLILAAALAALPAAARAGALGVAVDELAAADQAARDDFYRLAAVTYVTLNKTDKAVALLEEYRASGGSNPGLLSRLGDLYAESGALDKAIEASEQVLAVSPSDTAQYVKQAGLQLRKGDADKAAAALDKAPGAPGTGAVWAAVAEAYLAKADAAGEEDALAKSVAAEPRSANYKALARLRAKSKGLAAAEAVIADGRAKLPREDVILAVALADICLEEGDAVKAEQVLTPLVGKVEEVWLQNEVQHRLDNMKPLVELPAPLTPGTTVETIVPPGVE